MSDLAFLIVDQCMYSLTSKEFGLFAKCLTQVSSSASCGTDLRFAELQTVLQQPKIFNKFLTAKFLTNF